MWKKVRPILLAGTSTLSIVQLPIWDTSDSTQFQVIFGIIITFVILYWVFFCLDWEGRK